MTVGEASLIWLICPCSQAVLYVSLSSNCRHFRGVDRMQPIEPFLHMLNLRGAFLAVPGCGAPDGLRVSLEFEHQWRKPSNGGQATSVQNSTVFYTARA